MASVRLILAIVAVIAVTVVLRAIQDGRPWREQLDGDATSFWKWIVDAQMQWPILAAMIGAATAMPGRVENLYKHGPPFAGVSLGCAIRFLLLFLGVFLLPIIVSHPKWTVWAVWGVIILADAVALWMHWDIQTRLEKLDKGSSIGTSA